MVGSVPETESSAKRSRGLQLSLGGLIVLVLAAGLAAGVARSARDVWGVRTVPRMPGSVGSLFWGNAQVPVERTAGIALEIVGVFLLVMLARAVTSLVRTVRPIGRVELRILRWGLAWRIVAACFLLWFISEESQVLRIDFAREAEIAEMVPGWDMNYRMRQQLLPVCGLFAVLGIVLGAGANFLFPRAARRGSRPYWLFVILAGLAAVLITATADSGR